MAYPEMGMPYFVFAVAESLTSTTEVTEAHDSFNGSLLNDTIYIGADTFESDTWAKTLVHEYTHFAEGTKEYQELIDVLTGDSKLVEKTLSDIFEKAGYGFDKEKTRKLLNRHEKLQNSKNKTANIDSNEEIRYNRKQQYNEFATNAMIWAFSTKRKPGDIKVLYNAYDNTWNKLVADETEERYGTLLSIKDTPENAEAIRNLREEVYYENYREKQRASESVHEDYERYWSRSNNIRDDNFDVEKQDSNGRSREVYGGESEGNRIGDLEKGTGNSGNIKYSFKASDKTNTSNADTQKIDNTVDNEVLEELTEEELKYIRLYKSELGAHLSANMLGTESFIDKLVRENTTVAEKILNKLSDLKQMFERLGDAEARAEYKKIKKAENLYLSAVEKAGYAYVGRKIVGAIDEREIDDNTEYKEYNKPITREDVEAIRSINNGRRLSVNNFASQDIQKTQKWAYKFYKELGVKSPFFRAWFGDWRIYDSSLTKILTATHKDGKNPRGTFVNEDTGWNIVSSSVGYDETISHSGKDKKSIIAMRNIDKIIENAILLDTETSEYGRGKKSIYTAFMHKFYSIIKIDGEPYLAKLSVDESYSPGSKDSHKKFYHVRSIEIETASTVGIGENHTPIIADTASTISISDLYEFVKRYDSEFKPKSVNKTVLNKDGMPRVFYHGTNKAFNSFVKDHRRTKGRLNFGEGFYFAAKKSIAENYLDGDNSRIVEVYLSLQNPFKVVGNHFTEYEMNQIRSQLDDNDRSLLNYKNVNDYLKKLGYDGVVGIDYDGVNNPINYAVAFDPSQIKSATDNIGTFDRSNPDIRFNLKSNGKITKSRGEYQKLKADYTKEKKYDKKDVSKYILEVPYVSTLPKATQNDIIESMWYTLNTIESDNQKERYLQKMALRTGRHILRTLTKNTIKLDSQ